MEYVPLTDVYFLIPLHSREIASQKGGKERASRSRLVADDFLRPFNREGGMRGDAACVMSNDIWSAKGGANRSHAVSSRCSTAPGCTYGPSTCFCTLKHARILDLKRSASAFVK